MNDYTDKELVKLFKGKDTKNFAFNIIVRKHQEKLYWHIRKLVVHHDDADDILQNTFIKVWNGLENFREASKLYTWLYRIATNETLTFLKQKKRRYFLSFNDYENQLDDTLAGDAHFNGDEIQRKLHMAIAKLPEKQRVVFNLKYFEEMKYDDMAEVLSTSVGALKASYHHAVKKIEKYIKES